jgi:hypothetical protein
MDIDPHEVSYVSPKIVTVSVQRPSMGRWLQCTLCGAAADSSCMCTAKHIKMTNLYCRAPFRECGAFCLQVNEKGVPVHGPFSHPNATHDRIALYHYMTKVCIILLG